MDKERAVRREDEVRASVVVAHRGHAVAFLEVADQAERRGDVKALSSKPGAPCDFRDCRAEIFDQDERIYIGCVVCGMERLWLAPGLIPDRHK